MSGIDGLPKAEFAFPGPLRERLIEAILDGRKTATAGLLLEYEARGETLPPVGGRAVVVGSDERPVALIETTEVQVLPFEEVDVVFARDEGEGFETIDDWRRAHIRFWEGDEVRAELGQPDFRVAPDTLVVTERFRLLEVLR